MLHLHMYRPIILRNCCKIKLNGNIYHNPATKRPAQNALSGKGGLFLPGNGKERLVGFGFIVAFGQRGDEAGLSGGRNGGFDFNEGDFLSFHDIHLPESYCILCAGDRVRSFIGNR